MGKVQRQLRLMQIGCFSVLVACAFLAHWQARENGSSSNGIGTVSILVILLALWSATSGFTLQRKLQRRSQSKSSKTTPSTRWRAGHIFRLCSATACGLWGLVLFEFHGPRFSGLLVDQCEACIGNVAHFPCQPVSVLDFSVQGNLDRIVHLLRFTQDLLHLGDGLN